MKTKDVNLEANVQQIEQPKGMQNAILDALKDFFQNGLRCSILYLDYRQGTEKGANLDSDVIIIEESSSHTGQFNGLYSVLYHGKSLIQHSRLQEIAIALGFGIGLLKFVIPDLQNKSESKTD